MGGDDLFVLILCVAFLAVSILALRGRRHPTASADEEAAGHDTAPLVGRPRARTASRDRKTRP